MNKKRRSTLPPCPWCHGVEVADHDIRNKSGVPEHVGTAVCGKDDVGSTGPAAEQDRRRGLAVTDNQHIAARGYRPEFPNGGSVEGGRSFHNAIRVPMR
jgi:hypothetical protein